MPVPPKPASDTGRLKLYANEIGEILHITSAQGPVAAVSVSGMMSAGEELRFDGTGSAAGMRL